MRTPADEGAIAARVDDQMKEIKRRARLFVVDNFTEPTPSDFLIIETAMMIGASIGLEKPDSPKLKTYPATINGKHVQVTIPEE